MKRIIILSILAGIATIVYSETYIPAGNVSGTWTAAESPYIIQGDIAIQSNQVLNIEPGVTVLFDGHFKLSIYSGDLIAVGEPEAMITFSMSSSDTAGLANGGEDEGGWNGFRFWYSSTSGDTSRLEYCIFEFCKVREYVTGGRGVIGTERIPRLLVANCIFQDNYSDINGVDCRLSDVVIRNNVFRNNHGGNLLATSQANPNFHHNEIRDNTYSIMFNFYNWTFPIIERNIIAGNRAETILWADGQKCSPLFRSNMIVNNEITLPSNYMFRLNESEVRIENNLIANNRGRGIYMWNGNNLFTNNTIANNDCSVLLHLGNDKGVFNGNIIYGNTGGITYFDRDYDPTFKYNLIEGGISGFLNDPFTGTEFENFDLNPEFIDPTPSADLGEDAEIADFGLGLSSPAINRGDPSLDEENFVKADIYGDERVKYGIIDVGAAENKVENRNLSGTINSELYLFGDVVNVTGDVIIEDDVLMTIAGGTNMIFHGPYRIEVKGTLIAEGNKGDSILFTISDTSGFYLKDQDTGSWNGIYINNGTGNMDDNIPSSFKYCIFEYGKVFSYGSGGLLSLISIDNLNFEHCVFRNSSAVNYPGAVLYSSNSSFNFTNCLFTQNWNEVNRITDSEAQFQRCTFNYNTGPRAKCISMSGSIFYSISDHYHNNSTTTYEDGVVMGVSNSEIYLVNDVIVNNSCGNNGNINLSSCLGKIVNSTIVNNYTGNSYFAGALGLTRTELEIDNTILYGNMAGGLPHSIFLAEENTDPDLFNCIIEGGSEGVRTYEGFSFTGIFEGCLDKDPHFIDPTPGSGNGFDAFLSNWQILDISPAINGGTLNITGVPLVPEDFAGNPRLQNDVLDIGAFEKGGGPAEIVTEPKGGNLCTGENQILSIQYTGTDSANIQWVKDGDPIPGATGANLIIDSARLEDEGNYTCFLNNSFGFTNSIPVYLSVKAAPEILVEPDLDWVEPNRPLGMEVFVEGSAPIIYQWEKDGIEIPDAHFPELRFIPTDVSHEGIYRCIAENICGSDTTTAVSLYLAPQICMVTVDTSTGSNLIVWEKKTTAPIIAYNVYRESTAAGIYDILATISSDELSVYTDTVADPTVQAYLYKITAIDESGRETDADLCRTHKTIHLLVSTNPELNTTQLSWDRYYGFDYQTYNIYRSNTEIAFDSIHSLASSLNSWTDPAPTGGDLFYRLAVKRPEPCVPTGGSKKAGTGPYHHSLSNMDDNKLKASYENEPDSIILSNNSINENGIPGALVGRLSTQDVDSGDLHTYHLVSGTGSDGNSSFTIAGDLLLAAVQFDFETNSSYNIRIRSTDISNNFLEKTFVITIIDTKEGGGGTQSNPPTDLSLNNQQFAENNNVGFLVGRLSATDPDTNDVHTYHLVTGTGDSGNGSFSILGDMLLTAAYFDYESQPTYSIRLRVVDATGNSLEKSFTITIQDVDETVGIAKTQTGDLRIYPNPFSYSATIEFSNPDKKNFQMRIVDLSGKTVRMKDNIIEDRFIFHKQDLSRGYYIIELRGDRVYRARLIIE